MSKKDRKNDRIFTIIGWIVVGLILPVFIGLILHHNENQAALNRLIITNGFIPLREKHANYENYSSIYLDHLMLNNQAYEQKANLTLKSFSPNNIHERKAVAYKYMHLKSSPFNNTIIQNDARNTHFCRTEVLGILNNMSLLLDLNRYTHSEENTYLTKKNRTDAQHSFKTYYPPIKNNLLDNYFEQLQSLKPTDKAEEKKVSSLQKLGHAQDAYNAFNHAETLGGLSPTLEAYVNQALQGNI